MNKPIRKVAITLAVLFLALFVNLNYVQVVKGSAYRNDPQNRRVLLNEYSSPRGQIVVQGTAVAKSRATNDELKYLRGYPQGMIYAPATGYYSFTYGATGIESAENEILSGDSSKLFTSKLANILTGRNPPGGSVQLTLNKAAQEAAYQAMKGSNGKTRPGAVVALDPTTGAILALVSTPSFDPNQLSSHNSAQIAHAYNCYRELSLPSRRPGESDAQFRARTNQSVNEQIALREHGSNQPTVYGKHGCGDVPGDPTQMYKANPGMVSPLVDKALRETYPSGSIFKIIDTAAALQVGLTPDTAVPAPQYYWPFDPKKTSACPQNLAAACVENFQAEQCTNGKTATLIQAFAKSCNTVFAKLSVERLGGQQLAGQATKFGLDPPYGGNSPPDLCDPPKFQVPLLVCRSSPGNQTDVTQPDFLAQTAIGQHDVQMTPMQAALLSAAAANNGTLMQPYLVKSELRPNLSALSTAQPKQLAQVLDPTLDQSLIKIMESVVQPGGTAPQANITNLSNVVVGGKTGTADVGQTSAAKIQPDAWFTGFALVQGAPKIAVAVLLENAGVAGNESAGGAAAGPVAKAVMEAYLRSIGVN
jgi:peptidoglycan glycosyltransferase